MIEQIRRLEGIRRVTVDPDQRKEIDQIIASLRDVATDLNGTATIEGDSNAIQGSVMPGANVGGGSVTINGGAAGGDFNKAEVLVKHADQVIYGNTSPSANGSAEIDGQEQDYLLWLKEIAGRVPLGKLDLQMAMPDQATPDISLNDIYVPLDIMRTQQALQNDNDPQARVPVPALEVVNRVRRLIILGDPGSGKTSFLNYLTLCLIGARVRPEQRHLKNLDVPQEGRRRASNWSHGPLLPIRLELREFVQDIPKKTRRGTANLVWGHIKKQLESHNLNDFAADVRQALRAGDCLVMFDGLDEIADLKHRQIVREAVTDFAETYSRSRFIVTCRVLSYTDPAWQLTRFQVVMLAPLSERSRHLFIDRWYNTLGRLGYIDREGVFVRAAELKDAAKNLGDLAQNPMLLTVMSVVHTYKGTLPKERARLYNDCIQLLLWDWQRTKETAPGEWVKGIVEELETREERLINGLCEVAFRAHNTQDGSTNAVNIPQSDVLKVLQKYLDGDWGKAQKFCDYVEKRAGLLIGKGRDNNGDPMFAFPHRGFQEFLAARYLVADREYSRLVATLADQGDVWREVLLLSVGHLVFNQQDVFRPLNAINLLCKPQPPEDAAGWRSIWWAAEMLSIVGRTIAEQDEHVGTQVVSRLLSQLTMLVEGGHLTPIERAQAADVLGWLGDSRSGVCSVEPQMIWVDGGPFEMGADDERHTVNLKPFYIACYPITNAQFRAFLADDGYADIRFWTKAAQEWRERAARTGGYIHDAALGIDNRPVVGVTWYEAVAYANWLRHKTGKPYRLLTEAEWERAAAGLDRRKFPFGNRASGDDCTNTREAGIGQTTAVGIFPQDKTPEGVCDLGGNVWEWTSSLARDYPYKPDKERENIGASGPRILRGGAYDNQRRQIHCTQRRPVEPHAYVPLIGFRLGLDGD
ncbi:MAG: SUMF1/EgtB/PvdO family nonheme iron enzyme [Anaerolineae bacterium]|nr:SUMF1/EgtB/PvdO family nonheme iron enzyme [Anaerolineae bacterium]